MPRMSATGTNNMQIQVTTS